MDGEKWSVESTWVLRDRKYAVCADVRDDLLVVQVEEVSTADRWRGQFEPKHIEELTRKTGNFKKFPIFLNMLESAITKSSDSVSLDLLTCGDLEAMWEKRLGSNKTKGGLSPSSQPQAKRYLILTYDVEFDRIHYPLALPYCGCPDPVRLQDTIRRLRSELERAKKQTMSTDEHSALAELREENIFLTQAKKQIEEDFLSYKREVALLREGNSTKEVKVLKKVVRNLEEEILKEHTKHQKYVSKKNTEVKQLLQEVEELRASERQLKMKVKSMTQEIAAAKHIYRTSPVITVRRSLERRRSDPGERNFPAHRFAGSKLTNSGSKMARPRRKSSSENVRFSSKARTPSPRFDPTAYVERKRRQQLEINAKLGKPRGSVKPRSRSNSTEKRFRTAKEQTSNRGHRNYPLFSRARTSSRNSSRASSYRSSAESASEEGSEVSVVEEERDRRRRPAATQRSSGFVHSHSKEAMDQRKEMSEIDARLNALQEFMKRSLESAKSYSKK